jgi:hypothetical protein
MPSGFQQDQNQLTPSYYRVVITMNGGNATWYAVGTSEGNDTTEGRISTYAWDNFTGNDRPTTLVKARALARGNLRFQTIVEAVENLADCQILDIEGDAVFTGDAQADNGDIAFTIKFDRDEGVLPALAAIKKAQGWGIDGTITYDNVTYPQYYCYVDNGDTVNNTNDAIRDVIWNALAIDHTRSVRVFHPVEGSDPLEGEGFQEYITVSKPFDNDTNGWQDITVQEIDGTTTTIITD